MRKSHVGLAALLIASVTSMAAEPVLLDDQFELPPGFHIYRAASPELTGGSYDLTFDGEGRLLVAEGNSLRRVVDNDRDGVYDAQETIADGAPLRGRGPQGLLVLGDHVYAVSGDGVQLLGGYEAGGKLKHERRLGAPFHTGGDHAAHTLLRGLDGFIYLVSGDGGGIGGRTHITEESSPVREERAASVFRFDPRGESWECIGSGGRNPPSLGMNHLGELFSFDSDMEFHVDVPFYRPVRLNHWATGGDQGWQGVGAYPPHFVDCLPGVLEVGRGSPDWGVVYEHTQFPRAYRDAFIVCDYRWKSATTGGYASSGRVVVFHLKREGGTWRAEMTELVRARPGAKDQDGRSINFAPVDVDVAPDGSLLVSDHNQGVWRVFHDPAERPEVPPIVPEWSVPTRDLLSALLALPQPASEWSRLRELAIRTRPGFDADEALREAALDDALPARSRLRAVRLLAPQFATLPGEFLSRLAESRVEEIRAQAAWLLGIRKRAEHETVLRLLDDPAPFVRRRAAEALMRMPTEKADAALVARLADADRFVRYAAMVALSHRPTGAYFAAASRASSPQTLIRLLVAAHLRKERPGADEAVEVILRLLARRELVAEDRTDLLRVLSLYRREVEAAPGCLRLARAHLLSDFPHADRNVRWEQIRLLGEYRLREAFVPLVDELLAEEDHVTQFHIATSLADLPRSDLATEASHCERLADWLISTQRGWFSEFGGKGLQFPGFWGTVLNKLGGLHADRLVARLGQLEPDSQLARITLSRIDSAPDADAILIDHYRRASDDAARRRILETLQRVSTPRARRFILEELASAKDRDLRRALLVAAAANGGGAPDVFLSALFEFDEADVVASCAAALAASGKSLDEIEWSPEKPIAGHAGARAVHFRLLELMERAPGLATQLEPALSVLSAHRASRTRQPRVIWSSTAQEDGDRAWFARSFELAGEPARGELVMTCDNEFVAHVNGTRVAAGEDWQRPLRVDITATLHSGENLIAVEGKNLGGPAGLVGRLTWTDASGRVGELVTDPSWRLTRSPPADWEKHGASRGSWGFSVDVTGPTRNAIDAYHAFTGTTTRDESLEIQEYWHRWYLRTHGEAFVARELTNSVRRPDEELHALIAATGEIQGDVSRGRALYLKAGCYACHGGIAEEKTTIFGPALNGVTARLKRAELADAIVYPSRQVEDRFRASVLLATDGRQFSGFITEQSDDFVSITDLQSRITRLPRSEVLTIQPQKTSLMPGDLLNALTDEQIRDLLAFLQSLN